MDADLRARLTDITGSSAVDDDSVSPDTVEQVEQVCAALAAAGTRIAVSSAPGRAAAGSRTKAAAGNGAAGALAEAVTVSVSRLDAVEVEADRLVARAGAGASLGLLRAAVDRAGLTLAAAVDDMPADTRVGKLVGRGLLSRRALTGIEAVLPNGGRVGAGGAVLKDVAGYDLAALLLGSEGRLALVTAAYFRLQPRGLPREATQAAGVPRAVLGDALERAFDPERLLTRR